LQRLNVEAKKIRSNLHLKTHFKGVESVFINPKQISSTVKKHERKHDERFGNYAYNDRQEKAAIEKRNEYKEDMRNIILEEKEKRLLVNSKEFSNYLNNKVFYNLKNTNKKSEKEKNEQMKNMNYLKKLAFEEVTESKTSKRSQESSVNTNTESSNNDENKNAKTVNFDNENLLRIGGKIYHMQNEMGLIAKEILSKCKFYSTINKEVDKKKK
jgi:hypothetical protein